MYLYSSSKGQAMLELALLLPALVILLLAIFLVGQYFNLQICLDMAVSAAIRAESLVITESKSSMKNGRN